MTTLVMACCTTVIFYTFNGMQQGGWVEFMIRETEPKWDNEVWTMAYNSDEELDGTVRERCVEYYSRVRDK